MSTILVLRSDGTTATVNLCGRLCGCNLRKHCLTHEYYETRELALREWRESGESE